MYGELFDGMVRAGTLLVSPEEDGMLAGCLEMARRYFVERAKRDRWDAREATDRARAYVMTAAQQASDKVSGVDRGPQI